MLPQPLPNFTSHDSLHLPFLSHTGPQHPTTYFPHVFAPTAPSPRTQDMRHAF